MQLIDFKAEDRADKPFSKLERSKAKRRQAIIGAARDLIRETGESGLSMRGLAARAGVSLATPYNLFGSKQEILVALTNTDALAFGKMFQSQASKNTLSRIFEYIDMTFSLYRSDPEYWRVLLRILYRSEDAQLRERLRKPRSKFLKTLLREAVEAGNLDPDVSIELVSRELFGIYLYTVQEWVHENISLERARLETGFGYSLILIGGAAEHAKPELVARRNRICKALETMMIPLQPERPEAPDPAAAEASGKPAGKSAPAEDGPAAGKRKPGRRTAAAGSAMPAGDRKVVGKAASAKEKRPAVKAATGRKPAPAAAAAVAPARAAKAAGKVAPPRKAEAVKAAVPVKAAAPKASPAAKSAAGKAAPGGTAKAAGKAGPKDAAPAAKAPSARRGRPPSAQPAKVAKPARDASVASKAAPAKAPPSAGKAEPAKKAASDRKPAAGKAAADGKPVAGKGGRRTRRSA